MSFITIDPGLNKHTGYAIFRTFLEPHETGIIPVSSEHGWKIQSHLIAKEINELLSKPVFCFDINEAFIEIPDRWDGKGSVENILKLSFLCGSIYHAMMKRLLIKVSLIKPREWKGQMNKQIVDKRIYKAIGKKYSEHISDAVGIGLWVKGQL